LTGVLYPRTVFVKRLTDNGYDNYEHFVIFKNKHFGYWDGTTTDMGIDKHMYFKAFFPDVENLEIPGLIFIGIVNLDPNTVCPSTTPLATDVIKNRFSGIGISRFSDDCYHIDQYLNNNYYTTPKSCISFEKLKKMVFYFNVHYPSLVPISYNS
jgi:hypothetical protein